MWHTERLDLPGQCPSRQQHRKCSSNTSLSIFIANASCNQIGDTSGWMPFRSITTAAEYLQLPTAMGIEALHAPGRRDPRRSSATAARRSHRRGSGSRRTSRRRTRRRRRSCRSRAPRWPGSAPSRTWLLLWLQPEFPHTSPPPPRPHRHHQPATDRRRSTGPTAWTGGCRCGG